MPTDSQPPSDPPVRSTECSARREALIAKVKRDIQNVSRIYPTAFNLYDEPLDRLARRVVATMEAQNTQKRVHRSLRRAAVRVQPLVMRVGWAVQIRRQDGSTFFACGSRGVVTPVWNLGNKKYANNFVRELREANFDAKRVRVDYAEPRSHNDKLTGGQLEKYEQ